MADKPLMTVDYNGVRYEAPEAIALDLDRQHYWMQRGDDVDPDDKDQARQSLEWRVQGLESDGAISRVGKAPDEYFRIDGEIHTPADHAEGRQQEYEERCRNEDWRHNVRDYTRGERLTVHASDMVDRVAERLGGGDARHRPSLVVDQGRLHRVSNDLEQKLWQASRDEDPKRFEELLQAGLKTGDARLTLEPQPAGGLRYGEHELKAGIPVVTRIETERDRATERAYEQAHATPTRFNPEQPAVIAVDGLLYTMTREAQTRLYNAASGRDFDETFRAETHNNSITRLPSTERGVIVEASFRRANVEAKPTMKSGAETVDNPALRTREERATAQRQDLERMTGRVRMRF